MAFGTSLFLFAAGAVLRYAVTQHSAGNVDLHAVGVILMIIGVIGFLVSLLFFASWSPWYRGGRYEERAYIRDHDHLV